MTPTFVPNISILGHDAAPLCVPSVCKAASRLLARIETGKLEALYLSDLEAVSCESSDFRAALIAANVLARGSTFYRINKPNEAVPPFEAMRDPESHIVRWELRAQLPTSAAVAAVLSDRA